MEITIVSGSFPEMRCGVGDYTARLVEQFNKQGIRVNVITSRDKTVKAVKGRLLSVFPLVKKWDFSCLPVIKKSWKNWRQG